MTLALALWIGLFAICVVLLGWIIWNVGTAVL